MNAEPKSPFPPRADRSLLGRLSKPMGSPGQALAVYRLLDHPGWLFKEYRPGQLRESDELRLSRLISLPDKLTAADRGLLLGHTCWMQTQVLDGQRTVGVLIPEAPARYFAQLQGPDGAREHDALLLTQLASAEDSFQRVGLKTPTLAQRLTACEGLIRVGDLFERHGLVYGDWGYKNIFWSHRDYSVYFIDVDACSFGPQPWVQSFGFTDPQTPEGRPVDTYTERFRCAIAVAACLTGTRAPGRAISGLAQLSADERIYRLSPILRQIATSATRSERLAIGELQKALSPLSAARSAPKPSAASPNASDGTHIIDWVKVEPPASPRSQTPRSQTQHSQTQPRNQAPPAPRPGSNAPSPGAAPPEYHPPKPTASAGTAAPATPHPASSYGTRSRQPTTTTTRTTYTRSGAQAAFSATSSAALSRHQERQRRNTLTVSMLLLLMVAGVIALLAALL